MLLIPLQTTPAQSLSVLLAGQNCQINVYQKSTGLFLDLAINNVSLISAALCRDRVRIVREQYLGFIGDLTFVDTQGTDDPAYEGFGGRFQLIYLETGEA